MTRLRVVYWRLAIGLESPLRLTVDPVNINWRPLGFYVFVAVINLIVRTRLTYRWNIKPCRYDGLEYLLYTPEGWDAQTGPRPLVFLHGLGLGLAQYNHIISKVLDEFQDRPIFILLQAHISQDFFHPLYLKPLTRSQTTERLAAVMQQLGWVEPEDEKNDAVFTDKKRYGVTMLSHSKYAVFSSSVTVSQSNACYSVDRMPTHGCSKLIPRWSLVLALSTQLRFAHGKEVRDCRYLGLFLRAD